MIFILRLMTSLDFKANNTLKILHSTIEGKRKNSSKEII